MTVQPRKCSSGAAWQPIDGVAQCCYGVTFYEAPTSAVSRQPLPGELCPDHLTVEEDDAAQTEMMEACRRAACEWAAKDCVKACVEARAIIFEARESAK